MNEENLQGEFDCFCGEDFKEHEKRNIRYACKGLPFYKEHNGNTYCVLHYPDIEKREEFNKTFQEKMEKNDFNFEGSYFPTFFMFPSRLNEIQFKVNFSRATFPSGSQFRDMTFDEEVSFNNAQFLSGIRLEKVVFKKKVDFASYFKDGFSFKSVEALEALNFTGAKIDSRAFIENCHFKGRTTFYFAKFLKDCHFNNSEFTAIDFNSARFEDDALFLETIFHKSQFINSKFKKYASFRKAKFKDNADFENCDFFLVGDFADADFEKNVDFTKATFGHPELESEYPNGSHFEGTYFQGFAIFEETKFEFANFKWSTFEKEVVFRPATFKKDADFTDATFNATANFKGASFKKNVIFQGTILENHFKFEGSSENSVFEEFNFLNLREIRITSPEKVTFHTVLLRPSWFLDVDCRKFIFTRANWRNADGTKESIKKELDNIRDIEDSRKLFIVTCRQLAQNAEENNDLEKASIFRRMALEIEWLEKNAESQKWFDEIVLTSEKIRRLFSYKEVDLLAPLKKVLYIIRHFDFLHPLYRFTSYYGESWRRAFVILLIILAISTFLYTTSYCVFKEGKQGFDIWEAISYSLRVMALQRPEPQPESSFAKIVVAFETILAPLQLALLALAIRRKFMR